LVFLNTVSGLAIARKVATLLVYVGIIPTNEDIIPIKMGMSIILWEPFPLYVRNAPMRLATTLTCDPLHG
jgi:hypothetical protein